MSVVSAHGLVRHIGERVVLDGVSLTIEDGDRIGLVGRNGAGKSTLIRCLTGEEVPDEGTITKRRDLSVSVVEQQPHLQEELTVGEAVLGGLERQRALAEELARVESDMGGLELGPELDRLVARQAALGEALERLGGRAFEHQAEAMLDALSAPPPERSIATLSLGERRRVALAMGLLRRPDLLILDEPTNHLDVETIEWLEKYLVELGGAVLLVTHDRRFLERATTKMAELDRGELRLYEGSYTRFLEKKAEREAIEARTEKNRQRAIKQELEWVRRGPPARTTKSKSRLQRFDDMVADVPKVQLGEADFRLPHPARIGKTILELRGLTKHYGDKRLVEQLDLILTKGSRIGIVGPNGAGKTTLLRMILGEVEPDAGEIVRGQNTEIVYADQGRTDLHDENTVIEEVAEGGDKVWVGDQPVQVHTFLERLLFDPTQQRAKIGTLSGGERTRVALAKRLRERANLLILDEPTNDLDLATLRVLEDALVGYPGCVLVVSHDRWFLDRVTTAVLVFEGEGQVTLYEGGHADWRATRTEKAEPPKKKKTAEPAAPKTKKKKRTHRQEQEFKSMEETILLAEAEVEALEQRLADPETIKRLGPRLAEEIAKLEKKKSEVEALYARWELLSELEPYG